MIHLLTHRDFSGDEFDRALRCASVADLVTFRHRYAVGSIGYQGAAGELERRSPRRRDASPGTSRRRPS